MPFLLTLYKNISKKLLNFLWIDIKEDECKLHNFNKYHLLLAYQKYLSLSYSSPVVVEVGRSPLWAKGLCWPCNAPCCRCRRSLPIFPPYLTSNCQHRLLAWGHLWWPAPSPIRRDTLRCILHWLPELPTGVQRQRPREVPAWQHTLIPSLHSLPHCPCSQARHPSKLLALEPLSKSLLLRMQTHTKTTLFWVYGFCSLFFE